MPIYRLYSLHLRSPRPLQHVVPLAEPPDGEPDIDLHLSESETMPACEDLPWTSLRTQTGPDWHWSLSTALEHRGIALRLHTLRQGNEAIVYFAPSAAEITVWWRTAEDNPQQIWGDLCGWVLGSVMAYAMCLRGLPVLHGSVVAIDGQAVGLLGTSGAGKSTLAAALVAAGGRLLADDHLVVRPSSRGCWALPGAPHLRLWPSSWSVVDDKTDPPRFWTDVDGKRYVEPQANATCQEPVPLAAVYVLLPRSLDCHAAVVEDLAPAAALNALMNQRFASLPLSPAFVSAHLAALAAVAQQTPVRLLSRPQGLATLPAVVRTLQEDARRRDH